ncbi:unnamed protein product [Rhizoctonia solani]|uniref:Uncharacterized protein n=1 Tax=Rhizoctonia solani TaxID=456999 RepID=A0A8H3GE81_9AGAM|nr:unnamed protein product [Rhizoctonia solani]
MAFPIDKFYQLRYVPVPEVDFVGGVVATELEGLNKPIGVAADVPVLFNKQIWKFKGLKDGKANILFDPSKGHEKPEGTGPIGQLGFNCTSQEPGTPVELGLVSEFLIQATEAPDVYFIRPTGDMVGMDYYVGVSERGTLVVKGYNIGPGVPSRPRPAWRFDPIIEHVG